MSKTAVVKIGTSSVTNGLGELDDVALRKLCSDVVAARTQGWQIVLVLSGAVAAGMPALGLTERPTDIGVLQAIAAVGQPRLIARVNELLEHDGVVAGQVLLTPYDFVQRSQYLHARETFERLLDLKVLPIVNENDTVADDEIRYGDNDRLAALVSHLLKAEALVILTDIEGLFTADPRLDREASLIEEIIEVDAALELVAGGSGTARGSGGMASKLAAAKIAAWSGVRATIAAATVEDVVLGALESRPGVGTTVRARSERLSARKLWIAFAQGAKGRVIVDDGARRALLEKGGSLLAAGVTGAEGSFEAGDAVEVVGLDGVAFAKGLAGASVAVVLALAGKRSVDIPADAPAALIHRDDLVVLP